MPDLTTLETDELLDEFDQYMQQPAVAAIIAELKFRVIKQTDTDNIQYQSIYPWFRGLRPKNAPRV